MIEEISDSVAMGTLVTGVYSARYCHQELEEGCTINVYL